MTQVFVVFREVMGSGHLRGRNRTLGLLEFGLGRSHAPTKPARYEARRTEGPSCMTSEDISTQLQRISSELRRLEFIANASAITPDVLSEFRGAVDHARTTAWALQQQVRLGDEDIDAHMILVRERMRRAAELCEALINDLSSAEKSEGFALDQLYKAAKHLCNLCETRNLPRKLK